MGSMLLTPFMLVVSVATSEQDPAAPTAFEKCVAPSFEAMAPIALARTRYRELKETDPAKKATLDERWSHAMKKFEAAVAEHWPYNDEQWRAEQQEYRQALRDLNKFLAQAKGGEPPKITRDEAIGLMTEIAERYPGSEAQDKAYHHIGHLYSDVKPTMRKEAQQMFARAAVADGPLSAFRILSMANTASVEANPEKRLKDRQDLLNRIEKLRDPAVLKHQLLQPLPMESQKQYVGRVFATLANIEGFYVNTSANMMDDARRAAGKKAKAPALSGKQ